MERKRCARCGKTKPLDAFPQNKRARHGRGSWCLRCHSDYNRIYYGNRKRGHSLEDAFEPRF